MKQLRIFSLLLIATVFASCSKDDDPEPNVEDATLSFSQDQNILQVPEGLMASEDTYAQLATSWVQLANSMSANLLLFAPPSGATKSTDLITPANGRTTASKGVVYYWSDPQYGSVAYQVADADNKYTFELFYKGATDTDWYRYVYAEEKKDKSEGFMALYDVWGAVDETKGSELIRWTWSRKGDIFSFNMSDAEGGFNFLVELNTKTKAGTIVYFSGGLKDLEVTWDAQGKGSWKEFDESGAVIDEGTWE